MRQTRRRKRAEDPLASRDGVRGVLDGVARRLGEWAPAGERELGSLLRAAERAERAPERQEGRGRPPRWEQVELREAVRALRRELAARRPSRIAPRTFVEHYLSILTFPDDVADALETGTVNLFEAEQLARLSAARLGLRAAAARRRRAEVLAAHLAAAESGARLRARVNAVLEESSAKDGAAAESPPTIAEAAATLEKELEAMQRALRRRDRDEDLGPAPASPDARPDHLFYEHLRGIAFALEGIKPNDLTSEDLARVLDRADALLLTLQQIQRRGGRRAAVTLR